MLSAREQRDQMALAAMMGRAMVRAGLTHDHERLDAEVQFTVRHAVLRDLSHADAAALAVASIRGYVATHPVASPAEQAYDRKLRLRRTLNAGSRRLRTASWLFLQNAKAFDVASEEFAHPVHKPVENYTRVSPDLRADLRAQLDALTPEVRNRRLQHLQQHLVAGDVTCLCDKRVVPS